MPPRPNRKVCAILISALLATSLVILFTTEAAENNGRRLSSSAVLTSHFTALLSFRAPSAFFTPTATISLTDDNSTYFAARPAAFGPVLPSKGLSGQLWIGNGFKENLIDNSLVTSTEGELGCDDAPGWMRREWHRTVTFGPHDHKMLSDMAGDNKISGKVALLSRGGCSFSEKVKWAQRRGATAVIVGDNIVGGPLVRMYARSDAANISIPSLFTSHTTAHLLSSLVPLDARSRKQVHFPSRQSHDMSIPHKQARPVRMWAREMARRFSWYRTSCTTPRPQGGRVPMSALRLDGRSWSQGSSREQDGPNSPWSSSHGHDGLWVTLTPTNMSASPFLNTLFVLVVSPLVTLAIVYTMLLVRSRIRRRRWRAPKSIVERLPVRVYHTLSTSNSSSSSSVAPTTAASAAMQTPTTPLLAEAEPSGSTTSASHYGSCESGPHETEKPDTGLAAWKRKYGGRQVECVVCLEEYEDGVSKVMSLPCGHEFHVDCITPWLTTRRRTCPICKGDVVRSLINDQDGTTDAASDHIDGVSYDDVQIQAAETVNNSPSAAMPIPDASDGFREAADDDLERGSHQQHLRSSSWYSGIQRRIDSYFSSPRAQPRAAPAQPNNDNA